MVTSLTGAGSNIPREVLDNPDVGMISIRQRWGDIEPTQGQYHWTYLDEQVSLIKKSGKKVMLRIVFGGNTAPLWMFSTSAKRYSVIDPQQYRSTYGQPVDVIVWWDEIYMNAVTRLLSEAGSRYSDHVSVLAVPLANTFTAEWNVYAPDAESQQSLLDQGYQEDTLVEVCRSILMSAAASFPKSKLSVAIGPIPAQLSTNGNRFMPVLKLWDIAYKDLGSRLYYQANDLSVQTPNTESPTQRWRILSERQPQIAAQMLWYVYGDETLRMNQTDEDLNAQEILRRAVLNGVFFGTEWQEIYQDDVLNYPDVMQWASQQIV